MPPRLTKEIVTERLSNRGILCLDEVKNSITKVRFQCPHGHIWSAVPGSVLSGKGCNVCSGNQPLTSAVINERLSTKGIQIIGEFVNTQTKSLFKCINQHEWLSKPNNVLNGYGCPHCSGNAKSNKEIVNEKIRKRGFELVGDYKTARTPTEFKCSFGHIWKSIPDNVIRGSGCLVCSGLKPLTKDEINDRLADRGITIIGDFSNVETKTKFLCPDGHQWSATTSNILRGRGCPKCTEYGTNNDAIYIWKALGHFHDGEQVYKIGITSARLSTQRIKFVSQKSKIDFELLILSEVDVPATELEKILLNNGNNPHYEGFVGSTEFRSYTPGQLETALELIRSHQTKSQID
jgi:hypothetical protein